MAHALKVSTKLEKGGRGGLMRAPSKDTIMPKKASAKKAVEEELEEDEEEMELEEFEDDDDTEEDEEEEEEKPVAKSKKKGKAAPVEDDDDEEDEELEASDDDEEEEEMEDDDEEEEERPAAKAKKRKVQVEEEDDEEEDEDDDDRTATRAVKAARSRNKPPKKGSIGYVVFRAMTREGKPATYESIKARVLESFPDSKFNPQHFSWYRNHFTKNLGATLNVKVRPPSERMVALREGLKAKRPDMYYRTLPPEKRKAFLDSLTPVQRKKVIAANKKTAKASA